MTRSMAVLPLSLLLSGCLAPLQPVELDPPPPDAGVVYVYRPSQMTGRLIKPTIEVNGRKAGNLSNHAYAALRLPPGRAVIRSSWPGIPGVGGLRFEDGPGLQEVEEEAAVPQMAGMKPSPGFDVADDATERGSPPPL